MSVARCARRGFDTLIIAAAGGLLSACVHQPVLIASNGALTGAIASLDIPPDASVLVGSGDIADCEDLVGAEATAELIRAVLQRSTDAIVFTTGDHAYPDGTPEQYADCYAPVWGEFNASTRPTPGNHDYRTPEARGYFDYFSVFAEQPAARPTGYYAFEHGAWLIVVLNSLLAIEPDTVQVRWLDETLAASAAACVLAIWHHPLRSSAFHGYWPWDEGRDTDAFWDVLLRHEADVVLNGHDHVYERFEKLDTDGRPSDAGIRQFIVGTGGAKLHPIIRRRARSEVLLNDTYGVLVLMLRPGRYEWSFIGADGTVRDRNEAPETC
jgi:acid phosphatase type 7